PAPWTPRQVAGRLDDTVAAWRSWEAEHQRYAGAFAEFVTHSGRVLQGLTYQPTGAIVAAPTTSLPESVGGERNWDYRFAWVRDASLTLDALWVAACPDEAHNFLSGADSAQGGKVIGKFAEAAKQGRKERLGLFLITQDPQDIADAVFKQINTKLVLNLGDAEAISAVNIPANLAGKVPYMEKGQMVVYSPDNSEPVELIGLSKCLTKHD
ncbi:MAG: glycoside hydrolase family 15 protein, partial [Halalkalicoccus sp.]|nr:glycoside hydrolase family 15 protein [Halalkalicoccus sp.]